MDITAISTALSSLKTATDIAKLIKESNVSLEKAEFQLKIANLIYALAETKVQIADIKQILEEKDTELKACQAQLTIKAKLHWEAPYYWLMNDDKKDGPFCQHCYDKNREVIRLQGGGNGYWMCTVCKNSYRDSLWKGHKLVQIKCRDSSLSDYP